MVDKKKDRDSKALIKVGRRKVPDRWEYSILVVEEDDEDRRSIKGALSGQGYDVISVNRAREALKLLRTREFDLMISNIHLTDRNGMDILRFVRNNFPSTVIIMLSKDGNVEEAVEAMKAGAYDYLSKPVDLRSFFLRVEKALENRRMSREISYLRKEVRKRHEEYQLIGGSPKMLPLFNRMAQVIPTRTNLFIKGESGTGKELVARSIHFSGPRRDKPFIALNCSAFPETLLESELFGYEKGAFTGATERRLGKFELAKGGTVFLDEVAEIPLQTQVKLLRVLEQREVMRIGGGAVVDIDVRIISATNKELDEEVKSGRFREDLYYRLKVITLDLPPLRERKDDIPLLVESFIKEFSEENHKRIRGIDKKAMDALIRYPWPGNVRELRNVIEYIIVLLEGEYITFDSLPDNLRTPIIDMPMNIELNIGMNMKDIESEVIKKTLMAMGGNRTKTSKVLGLGLRTVQRKIKEYGIG